MPRALAVGELVSVRKHLATIIPQCLGYTPGKDSPATVICGQLLDQLHHFGPFPCFTPMSTGFRREIAAAIRRAFADSHTKHHMRSPFDCQGKVAGGVLRNLSWTDPSQQRAHHDDAVPDTPAPVNHEPSVAQMAVSEHLPVSGEGERELPLAPRKPGRRRCTRADQWVIDSMEHGEQVTSRLRPRLPLAEDNAGEVSRNTPIPAEIGTITRAEPDATAPDPEPEVDARVAAAADFYSRPEGTVSETAEERAFRLDNQRDVMLELQRRNAVAAAKAADEAADRIIWQHQAVDVHTQQMEQEDGWDEQYDLDMEEINFRWFMEDHDERQERDDPEYDNTSP
ncbi:uncharacterized protein LOC129590713 [Paramacrobiotus metropolitanus]|uniref:uncharacterized protein LOC129590713 n=1 Tax=Paramacrobiotus metropolitanus TaxID=2943436 RepID=UPI002445820F|nr:uncharacterized protein LOC129590713 [Paramacrobiotus metropolitanus]XP_055342041.1 uncharacterized protein LOC129590713 [Paramacrobiotus metropolitanus]